ncbi:uncharacterized protein BDV14DRAFT_176589 [Aspergillus stella-maris]|uniref:uncharacterized protein n=1 Tax=Aspergillus stella-maris TaxID=1810926 RepID=UPI003CCD2509
MVTSLLEHIMHHSWIGISTHIVPFTIYRVAFTAADLGCQSAVSGYVRLWLRNNLLICAHNNSGYFSRLLDKRSEKFMRKIKSAILDLVESLSLCSSSQSKQFIGEYVVALKKLGIFPGTDSFKTKSFEEIQEIAARLPDMPYKNEHCPCNTCIIATGGRREYLVMNLKDCKTDSEAGFRLTLVH